jgi:DNA-binding PadR family transcriptional regulator
MSLVANGLLGLLESRPRHGYELRRAFEDTLVPGRPLRSGQVYSTLGRLERDGKVDTVGEEPGRGPERKLYGITPAGVTELEQWLAAAEPAAPYMHNVLFAKVVLALSSGRNAQAVLDAQRARHIDEMRRLTRAKAKADLSGVLTADFALLHMEADLKWIEITAARLERLGREVRP